MRQILTFVTVAFVIVLQSCQPSPREIMGKSWDKCQSVENGYYEMNHFMKYMSNENDTTRETYKCYFKKLDHDSLFSSSFHYEEESDKGNITDVLYTGKALISYWPNDSSGTVMPNNQWADQIMRIRHNFTFYSPLISRKSSPLKRSSDTTDQNNSYTFLGEAELNGYDCYHILKLYDTTGTSSPGMQIIRIASQFWINKKDYIPVQYTTEYDIIEMGVDTVSQYMKNVLTKYEINPPDDTSRLSLSSVPGYIKLQDYVPYQPPELLENGTVAPEWSGTSLDDQEISLADLEGNLVLIDFFYKACQPCMLALPGLQRLHEKYHDRGLRVVGFDAFDTKEEDAIDVFLQKRGISYTVVLGERSIPEAYHVPGYPTMYLVGRDGKIVHSQVGYSDSTEVNLEEIILKHL